MINRDIHTYTHGAERGREETDRETMVIIEIHQETENNRETRRYTQIPAERDIERERHTPIQRHRDIRRHRELQNDMQI